MLSLLQPDSRFGRRVNLAARGRGSAYRQPNELSTRPGVGFAFNNNRYTDRTTFTVESSGGDCFVRAATTSAPADFDAGWPIPSRVDDASPDTNTIPVNPQQGTLSVSARVRSSLGGGGKWQVRFQTGSAWTEAAQESSFTVTADTWETVAATFTIPAGAEKATLMLTKALTTGQSDALDAKELMVEYGSVPGAYRDGTWPGWHWTGTPFASPAAGIGTADKGAAVSAPHVFPAEPEAADWTVTLDGTAQPVHVARVQDYSPNGGGVDHGGAYGFTQFDITDPVDVVIHSPAGYNLSSAVLRPSSDQVSDYAATSTQVSFTLSGPAKLILEYNGRQHPLMLFASAPETDPVPDSDDPFAIVFGPGIHEPGQYVSVPDGHTLYLAPGAVLEQRVAVRGDNTAVRGRGIVSGNWQIWGTGSPTWVQLMPVYGDNVDISGIILRGSTQWTLVPQFSDVGSISDVKILGGRSENDDGLDFVNASNWSVDDIFIRSDDDSLCFKGQDDTFTTSCQNITITNAVLWSDRGRICVPAHESRAPYIRNIEVSDVDVLHCYSRIWYPDVYDGCILNNVLFEDWRIGLDAGLTELIQLIGKSGSPYGTISAVGSADLVTWRDIAITGPASTYYIRIRGDGPGPVEGTVSNVTVDNLTINGTLVTDVSSNVVVGANTSNITFTS